MSQSACFSSKILCLVSSCIRIGNRVHVKSSGVAPVLANARPPGSAKFAYAPLAGLKRANAAESGGGGGGLCAAGID